MRDRQLLARGSLDHLANPNDVSPLVGRESKAERMRLGNYVKHATVGDVHRYSPKLWNFYSLVQVRGKCGNILEADGLYLASLHLRFYAHQTGRCFQNERRDGFPGFDHAGFDQRSDHADGIRARHRWIFDLLHDDEPRLGLRVGGRQQQVAVRRGISTRLPEHSLAQSVGVPLQVCFLLEHGTARYIEHTTGDHSSWFATCMQVYGGNHA